MKKIMMLLLMLLLFSCNNNEGKQEIIEGINWNMSKQEIKKILSNKILVEEREDELVYRRIKMNANEIGLDEEMNIVGFSFKNNKLQIIGGAIIRENNYENSEFLRDIIKNCNANQEPEGKLNNYSCDLYEQGSSLMLDIRYYNPKD